MEEASHEDLRSSATLLVFKNNPVLLQDLISLLDNHLVRRERLLDLGVGFGFGALMFKKVLGFGEAVGIDIDENRLATASRRGIKTVSLNLDGEAVRLPFPDGTVDVVFCFGILNYLKHYDNIIGESSRVLRPGGLFVTSLPNLGWWVNRLSLLFGFQPPHVGVSAKHAVGLPGFYPRHKATKYIHSVTLRGLKEILGIYGFGVVKVFAGRERGYEAIHNRLLRGLVMVSENVLERSPGLAARVIAVSEKKRRS